MIAWILVPLALAAEPVLKDPAYGFCQRPDVHDEDLEPWCEFIRSLPPDRCPGLVETCAQPQVQEPEGGCNPKKDLKVPDTHQATEDLAKPPEKPKTCTGPDLSSLASIAQWVAAFIVAIVVLVMLRLIWWGVGFVLGRAPPKAPKAAPVVVQPLEESPAEALPDLPDLPGADLLAEARRAFGDGRLGEAVELARGAALRRLAETGTLRLHRSRTDDEYVAAVAGSAETRQDLASVLRSVELHRWGRQPLPPSAADSALQAAARILGAGVLLLALLGPDVAQAQTRNWRYQVNGDAGIRDLLEKYGYRVSWRLSPLAEVGDDLDVLVLDRSGPKPSAETWVALRAWVEDGHVLVATGDLSPWFPELGVWTQTQAFETRIPKHLGALGLRAPRVPPEADGGWLPGPTARVWAEFIPEQVTPVAMVVSVRLGAGAVVGLADPVLLWNGALADPDNEVFLGEFLQVAQAAEEWPGEIPLRVQLATVNGIPESSPPSPSPFESMANARLLPLVLQFLALWTLVALWRGWPLGAPRDPPEKGRLSPSDHVRALADRQRLAGGWTWLAHRYGRYWWHRLGRGGIVGLATRDGRSPTEAADLADRIEALAEKVPEKRTPTDAASVEELWSLTRRQT